MDKKRYLCNLPTRRAFIPLCVPHMFFGLILCPDRTFGLLTFGHLPFVYFTNCLLQKSHPPYLLYTFYFVYFTIGLLYHWSTLPLVYFTIGLLYYWSTLIWSTSYWSTYTKIWSPSSVSVPGNLSTLDKVWKTVNRRPALSTITFFRYWILFFYPQSHAPFIMILGSCSIIEPTFQSLFPRQSFYTKQSPSGWILFICVHIFIVSTRLLTLFKITPSWNNFIFLNK